MYYVRDAFFIVAAMLLALTCTAQTIFVVPEGVERYARDINAAISSAGPVSLEQVFEEGLSAAEALQNSQLERLDEPTYQKVKSMMSGFWVTREEVYFADAEPSLFVKLAGEKGTKVDQAFFETLKKTYPDPHESTPVYRTRKTDYSYCNNFDGKTLSEIYGLWTSFQKAYPRRYQVGLRKQLALIKTSLEGQCICGGENEYQRELQSFLKTYATSPFASLVASRLEALKNKPSEFRFYCKPR
jgi:hypothetical protein